jgi:hypothetical protein
VKRIRKGLVTGRLLLSRVESWDALMAFLFAAWLHRWYSLWCKPLDAAHVAAAVWAFPCIDSRDL